MTPLYGTGTCSCSYKLTEDHHYILKIRWQCLPQRRDEGSHPRRARREKRVRVAIKHIYGHTTANETHKKIQLLRYNPSKLAYPVMEADRVRALQAVTALDNASKNLDRWVFEARDLLKHMQDDSELTTCTDLMQHVQTYFPEQLQRATENHAALNTLRVALMSDALVRALLRDAVNDASCSSFLEFLRFTEEAELLILRSSRALVAAEVVEAICKRWNSAKSEGEAEDGTEFDSRCICREGALQLAIANMLAKYGALYPPSRNVHSLDTTTACFVISTNKNGFFPV